MADGVMATPVPSGPVSTLRAKASAVDGRSRHGGGHALPANVREFMEPRFGVDFSSVRIHAGGAADEMAADLHADAFTVGSDIFFAAGQWRPDSTSGRRLIAHELAHTLQQGDGGPAIRRFVPCTVARMSLEECPRRERGEVSNSRRDPMIVEYITSPEVGYVIANFAVGASTVKASAKTQAKWTSLVRDLSDPYTRWSLNGLSDCHGDESVNKNLRQDRAGAVRAALPAAAAVQVVSVSGVPLASCITDNTSASDRAWNRSVLIKREQLDVTYGPEVIETDRPVPKPQQQPTAGCTKAQKDEIAAAQPIAVAMVEKALSVLATRDDPGVNALLTKYFNDASVSTYNHVRAGFLKTLDGLNDHPKFECEDDCDDVTLAYVRSIVGYRVHLCTGAFGRSDLELAQTLIHEHSHMYDFTDDEEYCRGGCSPSLDRWDAYDNADSYARFAGEAYLTFF